MKLQALFERSVNILAKQPEGFVEYMRSPVEIKGALAEHYGFYTLDAVIKLFAHHNMAISDNVTLNIKTEAINPYKEYDRLPDDSRGGWTGKLSGEEFEELKEDIKKNGIKNPVTLELRRKKNGDVDVKLGEGNHRLRIANELGIDTIPVKFYYST